MLIVGWKPILHLLFGPKNQSFWNKSGKAQPIRTKFGLRGPVKGVTTLREFWAQSAHFSQNGGWDEARGARVFSCGTNYNGRFSPNLTTKRKTFSKIFTLGVIFPEIWNRKSVKQAPHSGHGMHCREILCTSRCTYIHTYIHKGNLYTANNTEIRVTMRTKEFPRPGQLFIARQHTDARYWYSKSVCPSVASVCCPLRSGVRWERFNIFS